MRSYKDLEIYQTSVQLFVEIHKFSLELPKYEMYELGSQIRRSSESVNSNIVEGYGRSVYKNEFIRFLYFSYSSALETKCHLEEICGVYPEMKERCSVFLEHYEILTMKIYRFINYVSVHWKSVNKE